MVSSSRTLGAHGIGEHCLIVALGIAADGQKHALGLWDGSTENARVCQGLLANLQSRGLRTDGLLVILDGSKALRKAIRTIFGEAALGQRCQVHKTRNILEYLSDRDRPWAQAILRRAYQATDVKTIWPELRACHRRILSIVEPAAPATAVSTTGVVGATSYNEILDDSAANRYVTRLPAAAR